MKNLFLLIIAPLAFGACSHSISFRGNHFVTPTVSKGKWGGNFSLAGFQTAPLQVADNIYSSSPDGTPIPGADGSTGSNFITTGFGLNNIGFNGELTPFEHLSVYMDGTVFGLKWQFIKASPASQWVAAAQLGFASNSEESNETWISNSATISSQMERTQAALSLGYEFNSVIPYLSAVYEGAKVKTDLTNNFGVWNFNASGTNMYYSVGLYTSERWILKNLRLGAEYSLVQMQWQGKSHNQSSIGGTVGVAW